MLRKPRFVKCGSYYYNINAQLPPLMPTGVSFWFLGESDGVDVSSEAIKTILKEIEK